MSDSNFQTLGEVIQHYPNVVLQPGYGDELRVFVKSSRKDIFGPEAVGLSAMRKTKSIRVTQVVGTGKCNSGNHVIVLEAIESQDPSGRFFEEFGRQLAEMHRSGAADRFGFEHDNFLGATPQPNPWTDDWVEFWAQSRIGFQLKLAQENGYGGHDLQTQGESLINRLSALIGGSDERPVLIHGDLWRGNWLCDQQNQPVLIDPAVYFADREAEFGMTTLFGGAPQTFYEAYNEAWPMADGWEDRVAIYRLYHLLNHLNLFGSSYLEQCFMLLRRFSKS